MKCVRGGDSKYELSSALLVHVIEMSAFKKLIVRHRPRNTILHKYCFIYLLFLMIVQPLHVLTINT